MWLIQTTRPGGETVGFRFYEDDQYGKARNDFDDVRADNLFALGENMHHELHNLERDGLTLSKPETLTVLARGYAAYRANLGRPII
jgi:hypothetical protein